MARRKLTDKEKAKRKLDKLYANYEKTYKRYKKKYNSNLTAKLGKREFAEIYKEYEGVDYHPVLAMVRGQIDISEKQSKIWTKNLKRNIKEWSEKDPSTLTNIQQELVKYLKKSEKWNSDFFYLGERGSATIYNLITAADAWDEAVGS